MKILPLIAIATLSLFLVIVGSDDKDEYLEIIHPQFLPQLSQEEILLVAEIGEYDELLIKGGISAGGLYEYNFRIFGDGTGVLREVVFTEFMKEYIVENDYKESTGAPLPEEYVRMIEDLPEGEYGNKYISKLSKEDILSLLNDLGDGTIPVKDLTKNYEPGFGMSFSIALYLDGKATRYCGTKYVTNAEDVDVEVLDWLENRLIPLLIEKGETTNLDTDIMNYIPDELVGKYSFIEIRRD
jgi:hypothetical protein